MLNATKREILLYANPLIIESREDLNDDGQLIADQGVAMRKIVALGFIGIIEAIEKLPHQ